MLTLKRYPKRSPFWFLRGTVGGVRVWESTGCTQRAEADAIRLRREQELAAKFIDATPAAVTFAGAMTAYLNAGGEWKYLDKLLDHFGAKPMREIGQVEADAAAAALYPKAKASTINRQCLGPIIRLHRFALRADMPGAQLRLIKMRREAKPVVKPATDDHLAKLLPHLKPGLRALIVLMTFTGLRTGEALRVREEDCRDGYVHIGHTKNGEPAMAPIPRGWAWPVGGWGYSDTRRVGDALRRAHKALGLPYRRGHELGRHAFAARLLANGANMKELQEAGRWKKMATPAEKYAHLERGRVHDLMREASEKCAVVVQPGPENREK